MIKPWCAHFTYKNSENCKDLGWSGPWFCCTANTSSEKLGEVLAHEYRHVIHYIIFGPIYDILYSINKCEDLIERDCLKAERNPIDH